MNIGVDGGALCVSDRRLKAGVYRISLELLRHLARKDRKNTYYIYTFTQPDEEARALASQNMQYRVLRPRYGWSRLRLPYELYRSSVDIYLGLSQYIPPTNAYSIGFIYDLSFMHRPDLYKESHNHLTGITESLVRRSNHIITLSAYVKNDIHKHFEKSEKSITVAYPGVSSLFSPKGVVHRSAKPYFLFVGSIKKGKNIESLLHVFGRFNKKHGNAYNLLIAGGDYWQDFDFPDNMENVVLTGFIDHNELGAYYRGALGYVSLSEYEGFGIPLAEAMKCGCPVIARDCGPSAEVVGDGGILLGTSDVSNQIAAFEKLTDVKTRKKLSHKAVKLAEKYSWEAFAQKVHERIQRAQA